MNDIFQTLFQGPQPWGMIISVVLIGCLAGVISAVLKQFRKYVSHRNELEFKRDLVERGLSVEEIERIVSAKSSSASNDTA